MSQFTWLPFFEEMLLVICKKYTKESSSEILGALSWMKVIK